MKIQRCGSIVIAVLAAFFPALLIAADDTVATVNGAAITERQLEETINQIIPRGAFHGNISDEHREEYREKALEALITTELQYQDAVARKTKVDRSSVKEQLKRIRDSFRTKAEYRLWLERSRTSEDALEARVERQLKIRNAMKEVVERPARVDDRDVRRYYDEHQDKFQDPESVRVRIISVKDARKADEALARLKAGEDFGSVASAYSEDNFRVKGGDIGFVRRGTILPALEETAFSLKPGETSDSIISASNIFILKVEEKRPARTVPYEEARESLKKELETQRMNDLRDKWIADLRAKAVVQLIQKPSE